MRFLRPSSAFAAVLTGLALVGGSLVTAGSAGAAAATTVINGYTVSYDSSQVAAGATITKYTGGATGLTIPAVFKVAGVDYATTSIGASAFSGRQLATVSIPGSVTSIGNSAFQGNQLTTVSIPGSVTSIGTAAFQNNLLTSVSIPGSVTSIGGSGFASNRLTTVSIPGSVTSIGTAAFQNNLLTSVSIPRLVTSIGNSAFQGNRLTAVSIPDSVTSIGTQAFYNNQLASVSIPGSVTSIGDSGFGTNRLTTVSIPGSVTSIGTAAFQNNLLTSVSIPGSVTSIGSYAFRDNLLTTVSIPGSVVSIGTQAFYNNRLVSVRFAGNGPSLSVSAFLSNPGLVDVTFLGAAPSTITWAGTNASLGNATGLMVSYTSAFAAPVVAGGFTSPTWKGYQSRVATSQAVTFDLQGHGDQVTAQQVTDGVTATVPTPPVETGWVFTGWFADAAATTPFSFTTAVTAATTVYAGWVRDNTVTDDAGVVYALSGSEVSVTGSSSSAASVEIALSVTIHGVEYPVTSIRAGAFKDGQLTSVVIPASITSIGDGAFAGNPLAEVTFLGAAPTIGAGTHPFGAATGKTLSYDWAFDASNTAGGFTAPEWMGYATTTKVPVVFDLNGHGTDVAAQQVTHGQKATEPADLSEAGWVFTGWFADEAAAAPFDFDAPVTAATTVFAGWTKEIVVVPEPENPPTLGSAGSHRLETSKSESHLSVEAGTTTTVTATCPAGSVATDGSVRLDAVDQGTGTFADAVVTASGATADGRGWAGTVRNTATGQVQGKVNVVCLETKTSSVDGHTHDLTVSAPVTVDNDWTASGTHEVLVPCAAGTLPVAPSFAVTDGTATVTGSNRVAGGWSFTIDVTDAAKVSVAARCLSTTTSAADGHTHTVGLTELTGTVGVGAGQWAQTALTCEVGGTGVVSSRTLTGGLVFRGIDPQSKSTLFGAFNPGGSDASAAFGLWCLGIDTSTTITPPAVLTPVTPKLISAKLTIKSVTVKKTAQGAKVTIPVSGATQIRVLAVSKINGTKAVKGTVLTHGTGSKKGKVTLRLRGKTAKAILAGKVKTVRLSTTTDGITTTRVVRVKLR